jgi:spore coat polysaccharide biosynthesis protein SpsF
MQEGERPHGRETFGAVVQARMSSQRFPGKVLHEIHGKPLLEYVLERVAGCPSLDAIVVATSKDPTDEPIAGFCRDRKVLCHRGPLEDVAGRFLEVLQTYGFDAFLRINADSPLIDPDLMAEGLREYRRGEYDIVTNTLRRTYPKGQSVEWVQSACFLSAYSKMSTGEEREHVTKHFYDHPQAYRIFNLDSHHDWGGIQLSVDTPEDMDRMHAILDAMDRPHHAYDLHEILRLHKTLFPPNRASSREK